MYVSTPAHGTLPQANLRWHADTPARRAWTSCGMPKLNLQRNQLSTELNRGLTRRGERSWMYFLRMRAW